MSQLPDRPDLDQVREAGQAVTGVLSAEARELIDGQYADRTHLRPVLDAVLAALPGARPGDGAGPHDPGQPGHPPPHLRRGAGDDQEPGGPRPAAGQHGRPAAAC